MAYICELCNRDTERAQISIQSLVIPIEHCKHCNKYWIDPVDTQDLDHTISDSKGLYGANCSDEDFIELKIRSVFGSDITVKFCEVCGFCSREKATQKIK